MRIPQDLLDALDKQANTENISREEAFRAAISHYTDTPYTRPLRTDAKHVTPEELLEANRTQSRIRMRAMRARKKVDKNV